jgi:hypothetical protein
MEVSNIVNLAQAMHSARLQQQHASAIFKLVRDQSQQQGENVMALLQSVPQAGAAGGHIDVNA